VGWREGEKDGEEGEEQGAPSTPALIGVPSSGHGDGSKHRTSGQSTGELAVGGNPAIQTFNLNAIKVGTLTFQQP